MDYINLEIDFIDRTLKAIRQYERFLKENQNEEAFDVTMYINSLTGLIIFPKENGFLKKFLPNDRIEEWYLGGSVKDDTILTIKDLAIQLRHCIAHADFEFGSDNERQIDKVIFKDTKEKKGVIAEFRIDDFKSFIELISEAMIENARKRNSI
ncbi:HEPN family nuclease [Sporocytophaga myxococcoides]|uniref:HEPN family nuclease n=1 Tax=Sporocytophaga myxococcoides TaxID=153721 RepID=UPI00041689B4|nr:HEPN family nuclease [Sporocytophaga myxococcoides]